MQDIVGCRIVLENSATQEQATHALRALFPHAAVVDRRTRPSHGYRAVHLIVRLREAFVEVQVRSSLQHLWAELSEMWADEIDPDIKYGGGPEDRQLLLAQLSRTIAKLDLFDAQLPEIQATLSKMRVAAAQIPLPGDHAVGSTIEKTEQTLAEVSKQLEDARIVLHSQLKRALSSRDPDRGEP